MLIDTDVHEYMHSKLELLPHLTDYWKHYLTTYTIDRGPNIGSDYPYAAVVDTPGRAEWMLPRGFMGTDLKAMQSHLFDGESVDIGILNGFFYPSVMKGNFEFAGALAAAYNDWQIAEWLDKEPRLRGSVHVVAHDPLEAAHEIDRVAQHPQIVQVFLPLVVDRQYGDPMYRPIYEAAVRNDLVVAFHHDGASRTVVGYPRYWIEWHSLAPPQCAQGQLASLIFNGTFDAFPELKVVLLETGTAWLPWFMRRLDGQYRELRLEVPWVKRLPSDHVRDHVRLSTQPMSDITPREFVQLVEESQIDRVFMFSTDYPHFDADSAEDVLPTNSIPAAILERVRYRNALETYPRLTATS